MSSAAAPSLTGGQTDSAATMEVVTTPRKSVARATTATAHLPVQASAEASGEALIVADSEADAAAVVVATEAEGVV